MSTDQKGCMDRNECLDLPCLNGASCINLEPKLRYRCVCLDGFWGENCELIQEGQTLKLSMSALAAILVCLLVILSEHQISPILFVITIFILINPKRINDSNFKYTYTFNTLNASNTIHTIHPTNNQSTNIVHRLHSKLVDVYIISYILYCKL